MFLFCWLCCSCCCCVLFFFCFFFIYLFEVLQHDWNINFTDLVCCVWEAVSASIVGTRNPSGRCRTVFTIATPERIRWIEMLFLSYIYSHAAYTICVVYIHYLFIVYSMSRAEKASRSRRVCGATFRGCRYTRALWWDWHDSKPDTPNEK